MFNAQNEENFRSLQSKKKSTQKNWNELNKVIDDYRNVLSTLDELPKKFRHEIMVPFGTQAFVPGHIVHTNEVIMQLGDNVFAGRTMHACKETLQRRLAFAIATKNNVENEIKSMDSELEILQNYDIGKERDPQYGGHRMNSSKPGTQSGHLEIIEEYHSDEDKAQPARASSTKVEAVKDLVLEKNLVVDHMNTPEGNAKPKLSKFKEKLLRSKQ